MRLENSFIQIPQVGETTERRLWENGITDWRMDIDTAPIRPAAKSAIQAFAQEAAVELDAENVHYFNERLPSKARWRLADSFDDRATALDIETTGLDPTNSVVTTVSFTGPRGTRTLVRGQDLTTERLAAEFDAVDFIITYNGARFDLPFLTEHFDIAIDVPHLDLLYPCRRAGLTGGLKAVEHELGIQRELPDVDGRMAIRLWRQAERGDDTALSQLIRYNQEDTETLFPVLSEVTDVLDRQVFRPYIASGTG